MNRAEFLRAVSAAWTPASGDPWALASHAEAFADHVDRANGSRSVPLPYGKAVVIDGDRKAVVCSSYAYKLDPTTFEAAAGEVTSVMRGVDLLAGHIGDRPRVDPIARQILGPVPTDEDLAYLLEQGCTDLLHAARCFALLHTGPRSRVNLYPDEKAAAIAATKEPTR